MDEIKEIYEKSLQFTKKLRDLEHDIGRQLHELLYNQPGDNQTTPLKDATNLTPQPEKKRPKRLTTLNENDENNVIGNLSRTKNSVLLGSLTETKDEKSFSSRRSPKPSSRNTQKSNLEIAVPTVTKTTANIFSSASELMPPPSAPATVVSSISDQSHSRPQRAAKINCEKHLKEPPLNSKLRRPTNESFTGVKIKEEREQRISQMLESTATLKRVDSTASTLSQDSVVVLPPKEVSIVSIASEVDSTTTTATKDGEILGDKENDSITSGKHLRIRIKREKMSISTGQTQISTEKETNSHSKETEATTVESSVMGSVLSTTEINSTNSTQCKKPNRKKKAVPKPIKVERLSDAEENKPDSSISSRTRNKNKSFEKDKEPSNSVHPSTSDQRSASVYEEALESIPAPKDRVGMVKTATPNSSAGVNETVNITKQMITSSNNTDSTMILGSAPNDATYCTASAATFVLETQNSQNVQSSDGVDLTFNVPIEKATESQHSSMQSMETARDTLQPNHDSLITEDESFECPETPAATVKKVPPKASKAAATKPNVATTLPTSNRACKMPARTIEIFNPLVQSPVKKKVEAYENVAAAQAASGGTLKRTNSKNAKENVLGMLHGTSTTPLIGKLPAQTLGRFLTPNQSSNLSVTPNVMAQSKKIPASASKAQTLAKSSSAGNLKSTSSTTKPLSRENSAEEFRKGLHQLAEERKKQREQKHLLAQQQREAKERERAERLAKVTKEREEKRLKKQQIAEQKKRELEEMQKKLRVQEEQAAAEIAKQKAKLLSEQEKTLMQQMKPPYGGAIPKARMQPPHPKIQNKYTFEMLHEDDSTDDENKTSYKRPPPPTWSRSHVRGPSILKQQVMPTAIVDSFFSVQPMTPDLKNIFPAIDPRYLKRNSSVLWSTPPRYSELPKY